MNGNRRHWPFVVRLGLWKVTSRSSAWMYFGLSMVIAVGCIAYGFVDRRFFIGGILVLAAVWYFLAIRWVDQHGTWHQ